MHLFILICYICLSPNILTIWYCSGLYLFCGGFLLLLNEGGIFIGFLWVIDLGVGLLFLLFIVTNSSYLHHNNVVDISSVRNTFPFFFVIFFLIWPYCDLFFNFHNNIFFFPFLLSWYDFWELYYSFEITDLNLLREIYFIHESWEFFLINFFIIYGLLSSIFFFFIGKRFFRLSRGWEKIPFFFASLIRHQDFIKQQRVASNVRHWEKTFFSPSSPNGKS